MPESLTRVSVTLTTTQARHTILDMSVKCFFLEPIRQARLSLRRYNFSYSDDEKCPLKGYYHNAHVPLFDVPETYEFDEQANSRVYRHQGPQSREGVPSEYAWPTACECGYIFKESDEWQVFSDHLYRRTDTGEILTLDGAGPGAMWNSEYLNDNAMMTGPDGLSLTVKCPNGREWLIDGPCSNCGSPDDKVHKCWCRHGTPPQITVDKDCNTCSAGAGSIQAGDYHGFLRNGEFVDA